MKYICIFVIFQVLGLIMACSNKTSENVGENFIYSKVIEDGTPALIMFRSFQNEDKTWGFTIIINNVPFRNYNTIPYKKAHSGFSSKEEADEIATLFVQMIKKGIPSPKLTKNIIDSLRIKLDNNM